jgi:hypothetical protein
LRHFQRSLIPAAVLLSLVACSESTTKTATRPQQTRPRLAEKSPGSERFLRFVDEGDGEGHLDTALVTYRGPRGERVDLVAAVHVADRTYYQGLQKRFTSYDALLYEMVKPEHVQPTRQNTQGGGLLSFFQRKLKDALDLDFQLDGIDYMQPNFVHADLDVATFQKLSKDRNENVVALLLKSMADYQRKQRKQKDGKAPPPLGLGNLLVAFMSEDSSRLLKHMLAQQLDQVESALAGLSEGKGSVLLTERNKRCIEVLKERLDKGDRTIGIFYGGAHMPDLEKRLESQLGFKKVEQGWLTAWDIKKKVPQGRTASQPGK